MTGPATYANDADVASRARAQLDAAAGLVSSMESTQRQVVGALVEMWPTAAWRAAGLRSAKQWLVARTPLGNAEAKRLESIAELCARDERLAEAVVSGDLSLARAGVLAGAVTDERARWLTDGVIESLLGLNGSTVDDDDFATAVRFWRERVDEHVNPRGVPQHSLVASERLFGGGDIIASLNPVAFANVVAGLDAFRQDPDPRDAPYQRTYGERQADALDDMAWFARTHETGDCDVDRDGVEPGSEDVFDGATDGRDLLDEHLDPTGDPDVDPLRRRIRAIQAQQARRTGRQVKPRSGVTVNAHIDLRTLAGTRDLDDLDDLVLRGEGWTLTRRAAEQLLCDTTLVVTLFDGRTRILDANEAAERFSTQQRRAIAARDEHCVAPGCRRKPRHCDTHHLHERANGGPTVVANGCLLCRFHHTLLHQHRWRLSQDPDGTWVLTDPHGHEHRERRPPRPAAA